VIETDLTKFGNFITNTIVGCKFVGFSSDHELFIEFDYDDDALKLNAAQLLQAEFAEVKKVIIVERVNISQAKKMVDDLNKLLGEMEEKEKPKQLLGIESF